MEACASVTKLIFFVGSMSEICTLRTETSSTHHHHRVIFTVYHFHAQQLLGH